MQTTIPMLTYEDAGAMADWLCEAFGFHESGERFHDDEGRVNHAEVSYGDGEVMLGYAGPDYRGPRRHAEECEQAQALARQPVRGRRGARPHRGPRCPPGAGACRRSRDPARA